jgi:uncharacterized phage-associated protein
MAYHADAIANYFLDRAAAGGRHLDQMQVQKLVYYAHGWHLGLYGSPLINQSIQAWRHGPVISTLRDEFKQFGADPITDRAKEAIFRDGRIQVKDVQLDDYEDTDRDRTKQFLERIWETYGQFSGVQLSKLTHQVGTPWHDVYIACGNNIPTGTSIPNESIRAYFEARVRSKAS